MKKFKQILLACLLLFVTPLSIKALDTDETKKVNFSEITADDENLVSYNSEASRIEVKHPNGSTLFNTYLTISDYSAAIPYELVSFNLENHSTSSLDFSLQIESGATHSLTDNQSVLLEGDKIYLSYVNNGTFTVPKNFTGRIYVPLSFSNEAITKITLSSRNLKDEVNYYTSAFRVMNLTDNEFINDCIASTFSVNQQEIKTSLSEKYDINYTNAEVIEEKGQWLVNTMSGVKEVSMKIKDRDDFEIITKVDLSKLLPGEIKNPEVSETVVDNTVPVIEMKDGFVLASSLNQRILPLQKDIEEVVSPNSIILNQVFPIGIYILYLIAFGLAVWGVFYLYNHYFYEDE